MKKVVLAYSGGLDTSVILRWLIENLNYEVIACCIDVGQKKKFSDMEKKAKKIGAAKFYLIDAKKEFVRDYIFPALKANARYENKYFLATALARPLIAKKVIEIAKKEKADAVAHGATGRGNDQIRFELSFKYLMPDIEIIAPWRLWEIKTRKEEIEYARKHGIPVGKEMDFSVDENIWHVSHEGGKLEEISEEFEQEFELVSTPETASEKPTYVEISFENGLPVGLNSKKINGVELIERLNTIGGRNAIGRIDMVENRSIGIKSRGVYECPAAAILYHSHNEIESITLDKETMHFKEIISQKYGELVYYGLWYSPLKEALDAFVNETQKYVSGKVKLKLYKGNIITISRFSKYSLYKKKYSTFELGELDHKDSTGFLKILSLPIKTIAETRK